MIWGKAITLFLIAGVLGQRGREKEKGGKMDEREEKMKPGEKMGGKDEMRKEHDPMDLCMFTVDDEQCGMVDGCMVISKEDYMKRKCEMMGMDEDECRKGGGGSGSGRRESGSGRRESGSGRRESGSGRGRDSGKGRGGRQGGRRLMEKERGGRDSGKMGPRDSGMKKDGNMCISTCYMNAVENCDSDKCQVYMMGDDDKEHGGGKMSGSGRGRMSGSGRGGRRLMGRGPRDTEREGPKDREGGPKDREGGRDSGRRDSGRDSGRRQSGSGRHSGRDSGRQSGGGRQSGSGGRKEPMMKYCGPKAGKEVKTGLPVTVTIYTDDKCTQMLDVGGERRRLGAPPRDSGKMGPRDSGKMGPRDDREKKRVRTNPMERMIPVVDGEGNAKCSFDANADRIMGRFRKTTCIDDNTLGVSVYDDVLCSKESEVTATMPLLMRGKCVELVKPMREKGKGRRRLAGKEKEGDDKKGGMKEEWVCNNKNTNTLTDLFKGLMCKEEDDEEEDEQDEMETLYVTYEWKSLMLNGEMKDEDFCYKEVVAPDMIKTMDEFQAYCDTLDKCSGICKNSKTKPTKEEKKKGVKKQTICAPSKKVVKNGKVKCKKAGDMCLSFDGCKQGEKKGKMKCSGNANLN